MSVHVNGHAVPGRLLYQRRKSVCGETFNPDQDELGQVMTSPKSEDQRKRLERFLRSLFLFHNLDQEQMERVVDAVQEKFFDAGEYVVREGDDGRLFCVVDSGTLQAYRTVDGNEVPVNTYSAGDYFGEMYLMYGEPLQVTVRAVTGATLWQLERSTYSRIVVGLRSRKLLLLETFISRVPVLSRLKKKEVAELATVMEDLSLRRGEKVGCQGESISGLYILIKGALRVVRFPSASFSSASFDPSRQTPFEEWVEALPGTAFGGESLVVGSCAQWLNTVSAESPTVILAYISAMAFDRLIGLQLPPESPI